MDTNTFENGFMKDIFNTTKNEYIENNEPRIFNTNMEYSLKGIIEDTPLSNLFFSNMNINVIQMTIRFQINQKTNKKIAYQSEQELFIIMRSMYLQYANSVVNSTDILQNIQTLNKMVVDYCVEKVVEHLNQYDGYLQKISSAPTPLEHPKQTRTSYTYDMSNILR
tara:strand:+ start:5243 stop:5740 length:498 start_codon:yes stop_codon:yes gene_type:complete